MGPTDGGNQGGGQNPQGPGSNTPPDTQNPSVTQTAAPKGPDPKCQCGDPLSKHDKSPPYSNKGKSCEGFFFLR